VVVHVTSVAHNKGGHDNETACDDTSLDVESAAAISLLDSNVDGVERTTNNNAALGFLYLFIAVERPEV
jgi:hypothetical protein